MHPHHRTKSMIDSLTGLRAVAALWVMIFHSWNYFFYDYTNQFFVEIEAGVPVIIRMGYLGVDVFFVLSGFVMALNYWDDIVAQKLTLYRKYIVNRIARIYPAFIATFFISTVLVFAGIAYAPPSMISVSAFFQELPFILTITQSFFHANIESVISQFWFSNAVIWSLSFEWIAYLTFPFLVILFSKAPAPRYVLLCAGLLLVYAMYLDSMHLSSDGNPLPIGYFLFGWHGLLRIGAEFLLGMSGALLLKQMKMLPGMGILSWVVLGSMITLLFFPRIEIFFVPLLPLFMITISAGQHPLSQILSSRAFVYLGEISYSLYLIHLVIMHIILAYCIKNNTYINEINSLPLRVLLYACYALFTIYISHLMYQRVEIPLRKYIRHWS